MKHLSDHLEKLAETISQRRNADPETSYVARLMKKGRRKVAQKVGEEGVEVAIAAVAESKDALVKESADLLFHLLILWEEAGIDEKDVAAEFTRREGVSGLAEKKRRPL